MIAKVGPSLLKIILAVAYVKVLRLYLGEVSPAVGAITAVVAMVTALMILRLNDLFNMKLRQFLAFAAAACLSSLFAMPASTRAYVLDDWHALLFATPVLLHLLWGGARAVFVFRAQVGTTRSRLQGALAQIVPEGLARVAAAEFIIISNAFRWMSPPDVPAGAQSFSYHQLVAPMMWAFFCLAAIEAIGLHLLIGLWNPTLAWPLFIISDIGLVYLLGLICSLRRMPITIDGDEVRIRAGILYDFRVPLASIVNASTAFPSSDVKLPGTLKTSLMAFPNIMLELSPTIPSPKPMGLGDPVHRIAIALDDRAAFISALRSMAVKSANA